jgi:hypothetical protein
MTAEERREKARLRSERWRTDLGHLERDIAPMAADDLRADLDELLLQTRHRPILDRLRRRQSAQEIAEIVGQRMKLETDGASLIEFRDLCPSCHPH